MKENKEEVYQHHIQVTDKAISVFKDSFTAENIDPSEMDKLLKKAKKVKPISNKDDL